MFLTPDGQRSYFQKKLSSKYSYSMMCKKTLKNKPNKDYLPCTSQCSKKGASVERGGHSSQCLRLFAMQVHKDMHGKNVNIRR